jgi:F-type H+-transporting ATPase subunit b
MALLEMLNSNEVIAQVISFLLLLFLLRIFAWKRLLKLLDDRKERIVSEFKNIEESKASLDRLKLDYEARLKAIEDTARTRIQEAVLEGQKHAEFMKRNAHQEVQRILENGRATLKYELARTKEELKDQIIDLVLATTEQLIEEKLTTAADKKIVGDFLEEVDKMPEAGSQS